MNISTPSDDDDDARAAELGAFARLIGSPAPALLLDADDRMLLAANAAAERSLGLPSPPPIALDPAMPAWAAIRAYLEGGASAQSSPGPLLFWTPAGPVTFMATLEALSHGERRLVLVTLQPDRAPPADSVDPAQLVSTAARLAHELRTPLSAIVSLAEIMRDERLGAIGNPRYKTYAADIHDTARHTLDLIGAMLDDSREQGRAGSRIAQPRLELDDVDLNEIAARCASLMQPVAARGGITIAFVPSDDIMSVPADRRALRQIILNVLSNALRFTPHGGRITLATAIGSDATVELSVTDTGSGMSPAEIARTLSRTTAAATPPPIRPAGDHAGFGFGLPLVRELAEAHGGRLEIDSAPERGTCVLVILPAAGVPPR